MELLPPHRSYQSPRQRSAPSSSPSADSLRPLPPHPSHGPGPAAAGSAALQGRRGPGGFPACQGLSKGRRPILWASTGEIPTVPPPLPFAGRLRSLDPGVRRLELLVSAGDSGNFICKGPQEEESRTLLHVLGDRADCRAPGPARGSGYPQVLIPLLGAGLALGLGALGVVWWLRRRSSPPPLPTLAPFVKGESQRLAEGEEEEPEIPGDLDQEEPSLLYADLDYTALRRPCRLSTVAPADAPTVYAVVV
ncbi:protein G6b isoform X1 [Heterocephalus glaber]|uniref:Protein G6b isoform X1 n=1 Tax=Heterocephalus glaber TaxID=10181 RepID=A0AAX6T455_HETGA|nr:protein G6b isoform X1 [Heterocephalus glaber]XP_021115759.1 protein G6b isoform X1 [Heterocephalus glaber]XP_021115761.1 protein G6b isoform X1 [Heterocephalus glaber]XP_021115762.1 protein G6b isoform X1 [Heterocephalus glaber]XP_021115763.1 protein G6b isoform X1 [Heterocephalus glaber]